MVLPTVRATIVAPEPLLNERSFLRLHNRCAKEALRDEGLNHWKTRIPGHFSRSAHSRYGYQARSQRYMRIKARRWRSVTDLVKTGHLKNDMVNTPPVITIGGKAADESGASGGLKLKLVMPFHIGQEAQAHYANLATLFGRKAVFAAMNNAARRAGVTIAQMQKEIATIVPEEYRAIARGFLKGYGRRLGEALARSPRIRKRVQAAAAARKAAA
jgi:hypothetical protein